MNRGWDQTKGLLKMQECKDYHPRVLYENKLLFCTLKLQCTACETTMAAENTHIPSWRNKQS